MTAENPLLGFYAARLDEDQSVAIVALLVPAEWYEIAQQAVACTDTIEIGFAYQHIVRHDPARALREAEAGRRLIKRYELAASATAAGSVVSFIHGQNSGYAEACLDAVRDAASVWSDHPDYDSSWAPEGRT